MTRLSSGTDSTSRGIAAEDAALGFLVDNGLGLVERNFRCKMGEIDLIMTDGGTLVFVEVRLRTNPNHVSGAESITRRKIRRILRTAEYYLLAHPQAPGIDFRFDVISMGREIDWIQNAFTVDG